MQYFACSINTVIWSIGNTHLFTFDQISQLASAPNKTGYIFTEWMGGNYVTYEANQSAAFNFTHTGNETVFLRAIWEPIKYNISYNANTGSDPFTGSMPEQEFTFDVTQALLPNAFHRDGYVFNGWIDRTDWSRYEDQESIINLATENNTTIILYANWKAITYTIIFDANTGSGTMGNQLFTYNVSKALTSNSFTKRGYSFIGWNTERDGSGVSYQNGELIYRLTSVPDAEMTLYAQWEPVEYTISFDLNYAAELPDNIRIKLGDIIPELPIPERSGYTFKGWYTEDGQIIISGNEYTFDKDITLIAVWNKNASFNFVIIYIAGGASIILAVGITIPIVLRKKRLKKLSIGKNNNIN